MLEEQLCNLLNLSANAGLGRRLIEGKVKQLDVQNPNHFIITQDNVVEASALAHALTLRAKEIKTNLYFQAERIIAIKWQGEFPWDLSQQILRV